MNYNTTATVTNIKKRKEEQWEISKNSSKWTYSRKQVNMKIKNAIMFTYRKQNKSHAKTSSGKHLRKETNQKKRKTKKKSKLPWPNESTSNREMICIMTALWKFICNNVGSCSCVAMFLCICICGRLGVGGCVYLVVFVHRFSA